MVKITNRFPQDADLVELSENMRLSDIQELEAVTDISPCEAVIQSVQRSDPQFLRAWHVDGKLICICGCSPITEKTAVPWLLATDLLDQHLIRLTKEASKGVKNMLEVYPHLTNVIDIRQGKIIKWLKLIGFNFTETLEIKSGFAVIRFEGVASV